jgi:hypothetical protein
MTAATFILIFLALCALGMAVALLFPDRWNPAIFRPTIVEDTRATVADHFRTAIRREWAAVHIVDRLVLQSKASDD